MMPDARCATVIYIKWTYFFVQKSIDKNEFHNWATRIPFDRSFHFYCALLLITNKIPNISNILLIKVKRKDMKKCCRWIESEKAKNQRLEKCEIFSISLTPKEKAQRIFNRIHWLRPQTQLQWKIWKVNWMFYFFLYSPATSRQSQAKIEQIPSFDCSCLSSEENENNNNRFIWSLKKQ